MFRILWNLEIHYPLHNSLPTAPILSQLNPVNTSPSHYLNIDFNIIFQAMLRSSELLLSLRSPQRNRICTSHLPHTCYMSRLSRSSRLHHSNGSVAQYRSFSFSFCNTK